MTALRSRFRTALSWFQDEFVITRFWMLWLGLMILNIGFGFGIYVEREYPKNGHAIELDGSFVVGGDYWQSLFKDKDAKVWGWNSEHTMAIVQWNEDGKNQMTVFFIKPNERGD